MIRNLFLTTLASLILLTTAIQAAASNVANFSQPDFDRWNYPFNPANTLGSRTAASTFGAVGATDPGTGDPIFDDRDAQFLIGFDTASFFAGLPALGPGEAYAVTEATVTATNSNGVFVYDPTYDSFTTHLPSANPNATTDADAGRPLILSGAGVRPPFAGFGFAPSMFGPPVYEESTAFAFGNPTAENVRNAFAADANGVNISNNVDDGFDFTPFAVGQSTSGLNPGDAVPQGTLGSSPGETFEFAIDVLDTGIQDYLLSGLPSGLFFSITSLHATSQANPTNPVFYTSDSLDPAALAPTLSLTVEVVSVPEPTACLIAAPAVLAGWRRRRAADRRRPVV